MKKFLKANWKVLFVLGVLVFVCYANSLTNDFISDDIEGIAANPRLTSMTGYLFYNPVFLARTIFIYTAYLIGGLNPLFFRLINIFFHMGNVWLVYVLFYLITGKRIAFFTAVLFAVHPLLVESVSWISGGIYSQYAFFFLLSFLLYIRSKKYQVSSIKFQVSSFLYPLSLISFVISLSTSEKAAVLPIILLVYEFFFGSIKKNWSRLIPYFLLSFFWIVLLLVLRLSERVSMLESSFHLGGGLDNPLYQIPIAVVSYLKLIFLPIGLTFYHSELIFTFSQYLIVLAIFLFFVTSIVFFYKKNKTIAFWLSFFIVSLLPTLTPFKISWIVAERYVYLGTVGILFVVAYVLGNLAEQEKSRKVVYGFFALIVVLLITRTIFRNNDWKNADNLWIATVAMSPSSPAARNNLADVYYRRKDLKRAEKELKKAIELNPNYGDAYHNLGNVYRDTKRIDLAFSAYTKAVALNPNIWQSRVNLSSIYFNQKKFSEAEEQTKKALALVPQNYVLHRNLGIIYFNRGEKDKALDEFLKALRLEPRDELTRIWINKVSQ